MPAEPSRFANPRRYLRTRVTASLARDVTARYEHGESMRNIALTLGMGKATVLKILHAAEVSIKPAGPTTNPRLGKYASSRAARMSAGSIVRNRATSPTSSAQWDASRSLIAQVAVIRSVQVGRVDPRPP